MGPARSVTFAVAAGLAAAALGAAAQPFEVRVSDILGREVKTSRGERLAIRDLIIDPATGKVELMALGRPGDENRNRLLLYPVSALRSGPGEVLVLVLPEQESSAGASALVPALVE